MSSPAGRVAPAGSAAPSGARASDADREPAPGDWQRECSCGESWAFAAGKASADGPKILPSASTACRAALQPSGPGDRDSPVEGVTPGRLQTAADAPGSARERDVGDGGEPDLVAAQRQQQVCHMVSGGQV